MKRVRDPLWWVALAAGPAFWCALLWSGTRTSDPVWPMAAPWAYLQLAALYPILEEAVFRGVLQPALADRWPQRWGPLTLANLCTSLVFATLHLLHHPPLWAASVFAPSLVFGYFRERHQGLLSPMLLHGWYNAGYFWLFGAPG